MSVKQHVEELAATQTEQCRTHCLATTAWTGTRTEETWKQHFLSETVCYVGAEWYEMNGGSERCTTGHRRLCMMNPLRWLLVMKHPMSSSGLEKKKSVMLDLVRKCC
jgi:hypothetical protein